MAAGSTYTPLATTTLGSTAADVTFSSISGSYTDLVLVVNARSNWTTDEYEGLGVQFNSDTGSNYSYTVLAGNGSAASSFRGSSQSKIEGRLNPSYSSNTSPSANILQIQNYSNTTTYKTMLMRTNSSVEYYKVTAIVGLWRSTSAITAIKLFPTESGAQFVTGSTFTLYGIAAA